MATQQKKFIISLLIGTSFSVYGSHNDDAAPHNQPTTTVGLYNPAQIMTKEQLVNYFADVLHADKGVTTEESKAILDKIHAAQWPNFMDMCEKKLQLINKNSGKEIFAIARDVPAAEWPNFINICNEITPFVYQPHKLDAIRAVAKTDYEKWQDLADVFIAVKEGVDLLQREYALGCLSSLSVDKYRAIRKYYAAINPRPGSNDIGLDFRDGSPNSDSSLIIALAYGMSLSALEKVSDGQLSDFFNTVKAMGHIDVSLMESRMVDLVKIPAEQWPNLVDTWHVIERVNHNPDTVNYLTQAIITLNPTLYTYLQQFMHNNSNFFSYVPEYAFRNSLCLHPPLTQESLQAALTRLHDQYYNGAPQGTPKDLVFEIHNYANQVVTDANTGATGKFNDVVLNKVQERNAKNNFIILNFEEATALMQETMETMLAKDASRTATGAKAHYSDALNADVLNWVVSCQGDANDQMVLKQVVTFLQPTPEKLKTWLAVFMAESKDAYRGRNNPESCVKGVKERVITSLRNVFADDADFQSIFAQAEAPKLLQAKLATLGKFDVWAKRLFDAGARSTTPEPDAKRIYEKVLKDYFSDVTNESNKQEIDQNIQITLDTFDDSITEVSGKEIHEKGAWNNMFKDLLREHEAENNAGAANATGNSSMGASGEAN